MTIINPKVPNIQVGRDFTLGDISGQMTVGDNVTQTTYNDCTFCLPDGTTVQGKSWLYTQGIRPEIDPAKIFGREQELVKINDFFKNSSVLSITGFSGTGKSTLASMYADKVERMGVFAGVYWRKVDETTDFIDVVGSFFTAIGKPIKDLENYKEVADQVNLLFRELNAAPYFLILDNFEVLLDPRTNKPLKPGFSDLIERANENAYRSRFMFTSWECPASERGIRPTFYQIAGLDQPAAIHLLRQRGLTEPDDELNEVIKRCGGHPLALILLVQLVKGGADTLAGILDDDTLWIGESGEVAENILNKVYEKRLDDDERNMLQYVSLYREPVPSNAIIMVANDPYWTEAQVKKTGLRLTRKSLLQKIGDNYWEESLIMDYANDKLVDRIERHKLAYQYYFSLPIPETRTKKEDVQPLIEAHHHACLAKEYDAAADIIFDNNLSLDLDRWGHYRALVELYSGLLPDDPFKETPLLSSITTHRAVLGNLGLAYRDLGQVEKAIEYYKQALDIAREIGDTYGEGSVLGNLGVAYCQFGQIEKAIEYNEQAVVIAHEMGDWRGEGIHLGNLGNAYYHLGQVEKAIEYYKQALVISREIEDRRGEGNHLGNLGLVYSYLGQFEKAIEYHEQALVISREIGDRCGKSADLGNLGLACSGLGQVEKAIEYYKQALVISREIGDRYGEGADLGNLGSAYRDLGQFEKAIEYHEQALFISREIGDRYGEGNHLGNLGLAYSYLGQVEKAIEYLEKAIEYLEKALEIGKEINNPQITNFCEEILNSIKNSDN